MFSYFHAFVFSTDMSKELNGKTTSNVYYLLLMRVYIKFYIPYVNSGITM